MRSISPTLAIWVAYHPREGQTEPDYGVQSQVGRHYVLFLRSPVACPVKMMGDDEVPLGRVPPSTRPGHGHPPIRANLQRFTPATSALHPPEKRLPGRGTDLPRTERVHRPRYLLPCGEYVLPIALECPPMRLHCDVLPTTAATATVTATASCCHLCATTQSCRLAPTCTLKVVPSPRRDFHFD